MKYRRYAFTACTQCVLSTRAQCWGAPMNDECNEQCLQRYIVPHYSNCPNYSNYPAFAFAIGWRIRCAGLRATTGVFRNTPCAAVPTTTASLSTWRGSIFRRDPLRGRWLPRTASPMPVMEARNTTRTTMKSLPTRNELS